MRKCKVIAVTNQKGGVGKTTTSENVAIGLSRQGFDVLIVDFDPQGYLTSCLGWKNNDALEHSVSSMLDDYINDNDIDYDALILHHDEDVDLIPANIELADFCLDANTGNFAAIITNLTNLYMLGGAFRCVEC